MHSINLPSGYTPIPSIIPPKFKFKSKSKSFLLHTPNFGGDHASLVCKASGSATSSIVDFDLYDLLGVESSADQSQIKQAYRSLQKRCHPDIAGEAGHDMAIILNEAYAVLSDPLSRFSYDKEQAKVADFKGYTGKPIYSAWYGSQSEQRATFVDEVKCVGCLKCALLAHNTFAIESVYGRARVIAQWADPEDKIQQAIQVCPVDCISMVERSKLAALEFLMSKQPRDTVRNGTGNAVGSRVSNIFADVDKFNDKFLKAMEKGSAKRSKEWNLHWEAKMSAIQAIRSLTNWLYWHPPLPGMPAARTQRKLLQIAQHCTDSNSNSPNLDKLRDAVAARKQAAETTTAKPKPGLSTEYWAPSTHILPESTLNGHDAAKPAPRTANKRPKRGAAYDEGFVVPKKIKSRNPYEWGVPVGMAIVAAAAVVQSQLGDAAAAGGRVETHMGGSLFLDVVNSSWLQVVLAGITWYLVGIVGVEIAAALRIKSEEN